MNTKLLRWHHADFWRWTETSPSRSMINYVDNNVVIHFISWCNHTPTLTSLKTNSTKGDIRHCSASECGTDRSAAKRGWSRWNQHPPADTEGCFHGETHLDLHRQSRTWWIIDRYQALMLALTSSRLIPALLMYSLRQQVDKHTHRTTWEPRHRRLLSNSFQF